MVSEDDIFIAFGRPEGIAAGFQTRGANIKVGTETDGFLCGVLGRSATPLISGANLPVDRVGVIGNGDRSASTARPKSAARFCGSPP